VAGVGRTVLYITSVVTVMVAGVIVEVQGLEVDVDSRVEVEPSWLCAVTVTVFEARVVE